MQKFTMLLANKQGFTLLEVLVALAVLALGLAAAIHAASENAHSNAYLRAKVVAQWVAENELALRQLRAEWPNPDHYPGQTLMAKRIWYWQLQISDTPDPTLRRAEMRVFTDELRTQAVISLTGFLSKPERLLAPPSSVK